MFTQNKAIVLLVAFTVLVPFSIGFGCTNSSASSYQHCIQGNPSYCAALVQSHRTPTPTQKPTGTPTSMPTNTPIYTPTGLPTNTQSGTFTIGETNILSNDDSGNGNLLVAQQANLSQSGTIQQLSFYVATAAGQLRLGIYDDASGRPGTLKAQTAAFTPGPGWNTQNVLTPTVLPVGTYWLTYLPESNNLHFRIDPSNGSARYYSYAFGSMPGTFSNSPQSGTFHWSFYATLSTGVVASPTSTRTSTLTPTPINTPTRTPINTPTNTPTGAPTFVYPLKASANGRFLVDQNNVPFLVVGDSPHGLMSISPADQQTYLSGRAQAGINAIWVNLLCSTYSGICPSINAYGDVAPFTTPADLSTPNEAYFAQVDAMLNLAAQSHIVVFLDPIETGGWLDTLRSNGTTKDYNYGVYLGNRYKNFPNIVWLHGNDFQTWSTASDDAVVSAVAKGIQSVDPNHLQTVELNYDTSGSLDDSTWTSLIGLDTAYSYYPQYAQVLKEYNRAHMPVWFIEGVYEYQGYGGGYLGPYQLRNQEYWTQLSGSTGQLYGNADLYGFPSGWQSSNWQTSPGITQLGYVTDFFSGIAWYNLVPDQNHSIVTAGYGTFQNCCLNANSDYATAASTSDGQLVVAYLPTVRTITVNMSKLSGMVTARWYDPTNGSYATISGSPFANSGSQQFTPPGTNSSGDGDWVLVLNASGVP